jgi:hypothetical protein
MRESATRRLFTATFFALLAGLLVAWCNPVDHLKAQLRADGHGIKLSLELAAKDAERI